MSNREPNDGQQEYTPNTSWASVAKDTLFPAAYLLVALFFGVPFLVYCATLIHIYAVPVFGEDIAAIIARHPAWGYAVNTIVFGVVTAAAVWKWENSK